MSRDELDVYRSVGTEHSAVHLGGNYIESVVGGRLRGSWYGQKFKYQTKVSYEKSKGGLVLQILVNKKSW